MITIVQIIRGNDTILALDNNGQLYERVQGTDGRYFWNPMPTLTVEEYRKRSTIPPKP